MRILSLVLLLFLGACSSVPPVPPPSPAKPVAQEKEAVPSGADAYLEPAQIMDLLQKSKVMYIFKDLKALKEPRRAELLDAIYPERHPPLTLPAVIIKDGRQHLVEFPIRPEAGAALRQGEEFFRRRDLQGAEEHYQRALELQPDLYLAMSHLGDCALFSRRPFDALRYYDRAILVNPWDFRTWFYRANTKAALHRWDEALEDFIEALARAPRRESVLNVLMQHSGKLGVRVQRELFWPKAYARREGKDVAIYLDEKGNAFAAWLAYGSCKALWIGEPEHRKAVAGRADVVYSNHEDRECFMNLLVMYRAMEKGDRAEAEPQLDRLWEVVESKYLDSFLVYEFMSRVSPHAVILSGEKGISRMKEFIRRWVVVKQK